MRGGGGGFTGLSREGRWNLVHCHRNPGFWGLFASAEIKRNAELAQRELPALREKISVLEDERRKVNDTLYALKRRLFLA